MNLKSFIPALAGYLFMVSCTQPGENLTVSENLTPLFPDYSDAVVPVNIAPLNFRVPGAEKIYVVIDGMNGRIEVKGKNRADFPIREWRRLLKENAGMSLNVSVYARNRSIWNKYRPFTIHVKNDPVDQWLVYRLVAPGYEAWSEMGIYQRDVTSFDEEPVIDNRLLPGSCMNCHSFNQNNPAQMVFHLRGNIGATILGIDGETVKLNTKTEETISNCVYPYWHPSGNYIGFSVNNISQVFHSRKEKRIEVIDSRSDILVYDIGNNKLLTSSLISTESSFETFPAFTPDGNNLLFCSAPRGNQPDDYDKIRYSLCRIAFDASTGSFGDQIDTLVSSHLTGKSVSFPRVSPDGRFIVFTLSDYGNFSIWHREADLIKFDLQTGTCTPIDVINSDDTESYHSWASGSRWMVFSSRRLDGLYTRPYITYVDEEGNFGKPFLLPQKDPEYYETELRSFNVPEFVKSKVEYNGRSMLKTIGSSGKNVTFELKD